MKKNKIIVKQHNSERSKSTTTIDKGVKVANKGITVNKNTMTRVQTSVDVLPK
jgi:hypothetical protein